ncbi:MAG: SDR family oxidoreductase [Acidimicrobiia bacterium]|nr:SDR family oxidoreductase [Acidimicrobiia bacterium]
MTGGGDIGAAVVSALCQHGADVTVWDRHPQVLEGLPEGVAGRVVDVTSDSAIASATDAMIDARGRIDVLVNTAGILTSAAVAEMSTDRWHQTIEVNLSGVFRCCRAVVPPMIKRGSGSIVNISSTGGLRGAADHGHYCASKFGVIGLSESLALEVGQHGIRVNCICPGAVSSEMNTAMLTAMAGSNGSSYEAVEESIIGKTALRRLVEPADVANAAVFLASDLSSCITGIALPVSGGLF